MFEIVVGGTYRATVLMTGTIWEDRVAAARYLRALADLTEKGDLDEELRDATSG